MNFWWVFHSFPHDAENHLWLCTTRTHLCWWNPLLDFSRSERWPQRTTKEAQKVLVFHGFAWLWHPIWWRYNDLESWIWGQLMWEIHLFFHLINMYIYIYCIYIYIYPKDSKWASLILKLECQKHLLSKQTRPREMKNFEMEASCRLCPFVTSKMCNLKFSHFCP